MRKIVSLVIIILLALSSLIMFISSNYFYNYLEKSNNKLCGFMFYFVDFPRYSHEQRAKLGVWADTIGDIVNYNFPLDFSVVTNNIEWQKSYKWMRNNYCKTNFIKDFYYLRNTNWCEVGYFITEPGKKTADIRYCIWFNDSNSLHTSDWTINYFGYNLNKDKFYKTNKIFREGLFKFQK